MSEVSSNLRERMAECPPRGSAWHHNTTGLRYLVIGACIIEKNLQPGVIYQGESNVTWLRPLEEFKERFTPEQE